MKESKDDKIKTNCHFFLFAVSLGAFYSSQMDVKSK